MIDARLAKLPLTDDIIKRMAKQIGEKFKQQIKPWGGWLNRFKKRYGISVRKLSGESASADEQALSKGLIDARSAIPCYTSRMCSALV